MNKVINFREASQELIHYLLLKYSPDNYKRSLDEDSVLNYMIIGYIVHFFINMFSNIE